MSSKQNIEENKLIRVLKTLNKKELRKYKAYVESPYVNKNINLISLLDYISKFHPHFDSEDFTEENAFGYLFPDTPFKNGSITKISSKLFKFLTDYFTVVSALQSSFDLDFNLLLQYWRRNLTTDFDRLSEKISRNYSSKTKLKTNDFHNKFLVEKEINRAVSSRKDKGVGDAHFNDASKALDIYYLYTKLIYTCQEINRGNVIKGLSIDHFNIAIVEMIPTTPYKNEPIIDIWYSAYLLLSKDDKLLNYNNLKEKLYTNPDIPDSSQLRMLFTYLENNTLKIFKSRDELYRELFELYNFQIKRNILLNDEVYIPGILKNYMTVSLNLNKIKEANLFLESIKEQVIKTYPSSFLFSQAMLLFREEKYDETLDALNQINFNNIIMKLNERTLRLKVYHHLNYSDLLYDSLNSFRVFLTNNKDIISDRILESNRRFGNHLYKILKNSSVISGNIIHIRENIISDTFTIEKNWLLEQVAQLQD